MKKRLLSILLTVSMLVALLPITGVTVSATVTDTFTSGSLKYTVLTEDGSTGTVCVSRASASISGAITIPSSVTNGGVTYTVIEIPSGAFQLCKKITSITIPSSITSIGGSAFSGCKSLASFTVSSDNPNYSAEGGILYNKDKTEIVAYPSVSGSFTVPNSVTTIGAGAFNNSNLSAITIPNSVTSIGDNAFSACTSITTVSIPSSITSIGEGTFSSCTGLTSVTLPNTVTSIGDRAFSTCSKLATVSIPDSVTKIGRNAFQNCKSLTSITIPNSVTCIAFGAFSSCTGLTSINIPSSVVQLDENPFNGCLNLKSITVSSDNPNYLAEGGILYNKDKTEIITYPSASGSFTIPSTVTSIAYGAFCDCAGLTSVNIPDSVTSIGKQAFYYCKNLASVTMSNSITSIENNTFYGCTSLTSVTIPDSVTRIADSAFFSCAGLNSITVPDSVSIIGANAFGNTSITYVTIPSSVKVIGNGAFNKAVSVTFEGSEMPTIFDKSFASTVVSVDTSHQDSNVSIDIKGFRNNKSISDEKIWTGELLKAEVSGYSNPDELYYRFETDNTNANYYLSFYSSDTSKVYDGCGIGYMKGEGYAALASLSATSSYIPKYIKCSVYTWDSTNKKMVLVSSKQFDLNNDNFIVEVGATADKEFSINSVFILQQGDTTTLAELLAKSGFTHVICANVHFSNLNTSKYSGMDYLTVNEISDGDENTLITASTEHTGLSVLSLDFYTGSCNFHRSIGDSSSPKEYSILIYVIPSPEFDTTKDSITVADSTPSPGTSTYRIGNGETATEFTGLNLDTEYDVLQTVSLPIGGETYTGVYHNYVGTNKEHAITNATAQAQAATNNGYITLDKEKAGVTEQVTITAYPNTNYLLKAYSATYNDGTGEKELTVTDGKFTMPDYPVTVSASFILDSFAVNVADNINNGSISVSSSTAASGSTITVTPTPYNGYKLVSMKYNDGTNDVAITKTGDAYTFTMPAKDVTVSAVFAPDVSYSISLTLSSNITINLFTIGNTNYAVNGSSAEIEKYQLTANGVNVPLASSKLYSNTLAGSYNDFAAKDFNNKIHFVFTYDGVVIKEADYSVTDYCNAVKGQGGTLGDLCNAIILYADAADIYNEDMAKGTLLYHNTNNALSGVTVEAATPIKYKNNAVSFTMSTMSEIELSLDIEGYNPDGLIVVYDNGGKLYYLPTTVDGNTMKAKISASLLADRLCIYYSNTGLTKENDVYTISKGLFEDYHLLDFVPNFYYSYQVNQNSQASAQLKLLCKAMYYYGHCTRVYSSDIN